MNAELKFCIIADQAPEILADPLAGEKISIGEIGKTFVDQLKWEAGGIWSGHGGKRSSTAYSLGLF
jgi:hypothetical protein